MAKEIRMAVFKKKPVRTLSEKEIYSYLLWLLARRDYSRFQLEQKLKKRGVEKETGHKILDALKEQGLFKEENYQRIRTRQWARKGLGSSAIRAQLQKERLSLDKDHLEEAYQTLGTDSDQILEALIQKTLKRWQRKDSLSEKEMTHKLLKALMPKGHSAHDILRIYKKKT